MHSTSGAVRHGSPSCYGKEQSRYPNPGIPASCCVLQPPPCGPHDVGVNRQYEGVQSRGRIVVRHCRLDLKKCHKELKTLEKAAPLDGK